jgi:tRNA (guanine37-N1)-methyltransferase
VPDILLSGHHEKIKEWRKNKSIEMTEKKRPDLLSRKKMGKKYND